MPAASGARSKSRSNAPKSRRRHRRHGDGFMLRMPSQEQTTESLKQRLKVLRIDPPTKTPRNPDSLKWCLPSALERPHMLCEGSNVSLLLVDGRVFVGELTMLHATGVILNVWGWRLLRISNRDTVGARVLLDHTYAQRQLAVDRQRRGEPVMTLEPATVARVQRGVRYKSKNIGNEDD